MRKFREIPDISPNRKNDNLWPGNFYVIFVIIEDIIFLKILKLFFSPTKPVELNLLVEDIEERIEEDSVDTLCELVETHFGEN